MCHLYIDIKKSLNYVYMMKDCFSKKKKKCILDIYIVIYIADDVINMGIS